MRSNSHTQYPFKAYKHAVQPSKKAATTSALEAESGIRGVIDKRTIFFPPKIIDFDTLVPVQYTDKFADMSAPTDKPASSCKVMLSKNVANRLLAEVHEGLKTLEKPPHLVGLLANNDPAALTYAEMTQKTCEEK
jgi:hypothetical protein